MLINIGITKNGLVSFQDVTQHTGTGEPLNSFPCWFWDYDNDGWEDIFAASYSIQGGVSASEMMMKYYLDKPVENLPRLYRNLGNGKFENVAPKLGLNEPIYGMGSNYGDLNNDGFLDCYIGTGAPSFSALVPNKMYLNNKGVSFLDVTTSSRTGHLQKGHGVGFGDFDNDGDEDIFAVIGGAFEGDVSENALFMNPSGNNNPWLRIVLEGRKVNRSAIGARVLVQLVDSKGETCYLFRTVSGGSSFGGNSMELEFGLGDAQRVEEVHVIWPDKARTFSKHANIPMNKKIRILEGELEVEVLRKGRLAFRAYEQSINPPPRFFRRPTDRRIYYPLRRSGARQTRRDLHPGRGHPHGPVVDDGSRAAGRDIPAARRVVSHSWDHEREGNIDILHQ
ncbi:MAG: CRTAC1 family protein [Saprospirales bacterium]|nr:CRTAC1 family protein [Saprospirales bacterium]